MAFRMAAQGWYGTYSRHTMVSPMRQGPMVLAFKADYSDYVSLPLQAHDPFREREGVVEFSNSLPGNVPLLGQGLG